MWACTACSYHNLQDAASKCHICQTARNGNADSNNGNAAAAVIDLTDVSPKRNGGSMESNRRRRRRLGQFENGARQSNNDQAVKKKRDALEVQKTERTSDDGSNAESKEAPEKSEPDVFEILSSDDEIDDKRSNPLSFQSRDEPTPRQKCVGSASNLDRKRQYNDSSKSSSVDYAKADSSRTYRSGLSNSDAVNNRRYNSSGRDTSQRHTIIAQNKGASYKRDNVDSAANQTSKKSSTTDNNAKKSTTERPKSLTDYYNKQPQIPVSTLMQQAKSILKQRFGHSTLRPLQETAIQRALERTNQIIIMATGGGKSICYQLPALVGHGKTKHDNVTIVVCPLIALMVDQVRNLHKRGVITAAALSGSLSAREKAEIYSRLRLEKKSDKNKSNSVGAEITPIHLLYVTPELIKTEKFRGVLSKLYEQKRLFQVAIDEAHCVSTWGHDFRSAYKELSWLREEFPDVPVMACTGTATAKVIADIRDILRLDVSNAPCLMGTFNRTNISYEGKCPFTLTCDELDIFLTTVAAYFFSAIKVRFKDSLDAMATDGAFIDLTKVVQKQHEIADKAKQPCSGIVYVHKREDCAHLAARISKMTGLACAPYHAGLKDSEREDTQKRWTDGSISIAVATVAFGMGIDLAHVRYVIHWTMAKSLEGFYQESGRGGRDGKPSISILYYSKDDAEKFAYIIQKKAESMAAKKKGARDSIRSPTTDHGMLELEGMINYCTQPGCRRKHVLEHFGESFVSKTQCNKTCDFCQNPKKVENDIKAAECMSAVTNSRSMYASKAWKDDEQKFYNNPLESDESQHDGYESDGFLGADDGLLGVADYSVRDNFESSRPPKTNGFVKASSIIGKYEKMECQQGKKGGFANFKTRMLNDANEDEPKKQQTIEIPEHLRRNAPDPHASSYKKPSQKDEPKKQSAAELQAELDELNRQMEAKRADLLGSRGGTTKTSSALSVPSISFKKRR